MGNSNITIEETSSQCSIKAFHLEKLLGVGGFSKVWKAVHIKSKKVFALKQMKKSKIVTRNAVQAILTERILLSKIKHPFIVNMQLAFQDRANLYLVMDLITGGDLRYYLSKEKTLSETQTRFIVSCIVLGLEYLHLIGVIHRDIKPENLVFDSKGYLRITDFGIAHIIGKSKLNDNSGTPGYMSPEALLLKQNGIESDYYALGVIAYECLLGKKPFTGNKREIKEKIMTRQVQLKKTDVPAGWSIESVDFINKLLQRSPGNRLGHSGPLDLKNHEWLRDVEWKKLMEKKMKSPFKIDKREEFWNKNELNEEESSGIDLEFIQSYFVGYQFNSECSSNHNRFSYK